MKQKQNRFKTRTHVRPEWVLPQENVSEAELCPDCFKVVGVESRYKLVCFLGAQKQGATVSSMVDMLKLRQPTVTHHLNVLRGVGAVTVEDRGRERIYTLKRDAHCFDECKIPYAF